MYGGGLEKKIKSFDLFRKLPQDYSQSTSSGALGKKRKDFFLIITKKPEICKLKTNTLFSFNNFIRGSSSPNYKRVQQLFKSRDSFRDDH